MKKCKAQNDGLRCELRRGHSTAHRAMETDSRIGWVRVLTWKEMEARR